MSEYNLPSTCIKLQSIENGIIFRSKKKISEFTMPLLTIGNMCIYDEIIFIDTYYDDNGMETNIELIYGTPEIDDLDKNSFRVNCLFNIDGNKLTIASENNIDIDQYAKRIAMLIEIKNNELLKNDVRNIRLYIKKIN